MYGYVVPKKDCLRVQDFVLYRAFYCGICKATGKMYGQLPRFTTNYDMVFLSVLLHDCSNQDVKFDNGGCVLNPFKKKATVCRNQLLDKLVATNILLSYYKVKDDIVDGDGRAGKKIVRAVLAKAYKRAAATLPQVDALINQRFTTLATFEKEGETSIDKVSHCFSQLLSELAEILLGKDADQNVLKLCYNVGKFVYLSDALDDISDDFRKKRYNPFLAHYGGYKNRKQFISDNHKELSFILSITINRAIECFNNMSLTQSYDLLKNIVHIGLRDKCEQILGSTQKLPKPKI